MINVSVITGNLGNDPVPVFREDGTMIVTFSLAFRSIKEKTNWIKVTCFKKSAELAEKYLHKGAKVCITGILDQEKWESKEGEKKSIIKLIANQIEFIKTDGRGFERKEDNSSHQTDDNPQESGDDIPF